MVSMYIAIENPFNVGVDTVNMRAVDINDDWGWEQSSDFNIAPAIVVPKRGKNNRENFKKWYKKPKNQEDHKERVREHSKEERTYALRMVRELNNGLIQFENIRQKTKDKYGIQWTGMNFITTKY